MWFGLFPFRSPLLRESFLLSFPRGTEMFHFPPFASTAYVFSCRYLAIKPDGFPHSGISGSQLASSSPELIAGSHALHRLLLPRHPPSALSNLTTRNLLCVFHIQLSKELSLVEVNGIEPMTSGLQSRRSPD